MSFDVNVTLVSVIVALHVLGAAVWLGGVAAAEQIGARTRRRAGADATVRFVADYGITSRRLILPASLVVLLSGGWLMQELGYKMSQQWWLGAGMGLWLVAFLGSTMLRGPQAKRMQALATQHGAAAEDVQWRARRVLLLARGELLLVTVALVLMVIKPG